MRLLLENVRHLWRRLWLCHVRGLHLYSESWSKVDLRLVVGSWDERCIRCGKRSPRAERLRRMRAR